MNSMVLFLGLGGGIGIAALSALLQQEGLAANRQNRGGTPPLPGLPHFTPKAVYFGVDRLLLEAMSS